MHVNFGSLVKKLSSRKGHEGYTKRKKSTPGGFIPVYIGEEHRRYEVPLECLNSFRFNAFLNQHEEEILASRDEPISLLCSTNVFETVLTLAKADTKLVRFLGSSCKD